MDRFGAAPGRSMRGSLKGRACRAGTGRTLALSTDGVSRVA